jgi:hypothetical protein
MSGYYPKSGDRIRAIYLGSNLKYRKKYSDRPIEAKVINVSAPSNNKFITFENGLTIMDSGDWSFLKLNDSV